MYEEELKDIEPKLRKLLKDNRETGVSLEEILKVTNLNPPKRAASLKVILDVLIDIGYVDRIGHTFYWVHED